MNVMTELIKITEKDGQQLISAKELHQFLEVGRDFSTWCKQMIGYGFIENQDYAVFTEKGENLNGGRPSIDYVLKIDTAKHWSMMQRTEKGMQARNYFIACEKKLKEVYLASYQIEDPIKRAERWIEEQKEKQALAIEAKEATDNVKRLTHDSKTYTAGEVAKELNLRSATELNKLLESKEIQFKQNNTWLLYAKYADLGYVSTKQLVLDNGKIIYDRRFTGKGRDFIINLLGK